MRVVIQLDTSDYDAFSTVQESVSFSPQEAALITSLFALALDRENWNEMSDASWDGVYGEIVEILRKLTI